MPTSYNGTWTAPNLRMDMGGRMVMTTCITLLYTTCISRSFLAFSGEWGSLRIPDPGYESSCWQMSRSPQHGHLPAVPARHHNEPNVLRRFQAVLLRAGMEDVHGQTGQCYVTWWLFLELLSWYPIILVKSLPLIWRSGTRRRNLRVPDLQTSGSDLTKW